MVNLVLESISFGLEQNDFKFYQRRIADVRFLGELYNYRMLEHPVIFDTMYRILTFGHGELFFSFLPFLCSVGRRGWRGCATIISGF